MIIVAIALTVLGVVSTTLTVLQFRDSAWAAATYKRYASGKGTDGALSFAMLMLPLAYALSSPVWATLAWLEV